MNKKLFAFVALMMAVAMFSACGSQEVPDDDTPDYSGYQDKDTEEPNNNIKDKATLIEPTNLIQGINFRGILKNEVEIAADGRTIMILDEDYYKIGLNWDDSVSITASNASNIQSTFSFRFFTKECHRTSLGCNDTTIYVANQTNSLHEKIKRGNYPTDDYTGKDTLYIKISNIISSSQPNMIYTSTPYAITIKLLAQSSR
jgi:hypothetical protein